MPFLESCWEAAYRLWSALGHEMAPGLRWRAALGWTLQAWWVGVPRGVGANVFGVLDEALMGLGVLAPPEGVDEKALARWVEVLPEEPGAGGREVLEGYPGLLSTGPDAKAAARWMRKRQGSYYTSEEVIGALLEDLGEVVWEARRVCDPACGAGAMLRAVAAARMASGMEPGESVEGLWGIDLDPVAVVLCRLGLWELSGRDEAAVPGIVARICWGNALVGEPPPGVSSVMEAPEGVGALSWRERFAEVWEAGGFELVVANPPWERIKVQAREVLASVLPAAAESAHRADRDRVIARSRGAGAVKRALRDKRARAEALSAYVRGCGAYPWSGRGDVNTYPLFVERIWQSLSEGGSAGVVVPSGLATDYGHRALFGALMARGAVERLTDVENHRRRYFAQVDGRFRFALVVLRKGQKQSGMQVSACLRDLSERRDEARSWEATEESLRVLNPETRTLALLRSGPCASRVLATHRAVGTWSESGWGVHFQRMLDMTNDAEHFQTREALEAQGAVRVGMRYRVGERGWSVSLLEGKLFWQHDGGYATFAGVDSEERRRGRARVRGEGARREVEGRFWVDEALVEARVRRAGVERKGAWLAVRALTNPTNRRTLVAALVPPWGVGNSALIVHVSEVWRERLPVLAANLNALVLDDIARQKMGNTNINMYLLRQLPVLGPEAYDAVPFAGAPTWLELIMSRSLALGLAAEGVSWSGSESVGACVKASARKQLEVELDALYARFYGYSEQELRRILEPPSPLRSFDVLRREELESRGAWVTAERVLEAFRTWEDWVCGDGS